MQTLLQDLRFGVRLLAKKPGFAIIAIITVALGVGANTAIFSVINAVLLRSLPYHNAGRLVVVTAVLSGFNAGVSIPEVPDYRAGMRSLEDLAAFQSQSVNVTGGDRPDRVRGAFVSANFFKVFNVHPIVGRTFVEGEDQPGAEKLAVINQKMWHERLQSDPVLSGKKLILNGEPYSVIGVVSSSFKEPFDQDVEVWMPMSHFPGNSGQREARFLLAMGHLRPDASLAQAQVEAEMIANQLAQAYPKESTGFTAKVEYLHQIMVSGIRPMLWLLFAAVGVILLIACANLANLTLARGLWRQREIAVRAALGASKWRLIRQLVTETMLISLLGGAAGLLIAHWGLYLLLKFPQNFVTPEDVTLDKRVLLFALGVSILTGWLFGLLPALQLAKPELQTFLKEGGRSGSHGPRWNRIRSGFVVAQVALSLILLVGAGLLIRSFQKLLEVDLGFRPEQLLSFEYRLPRGKYREPEAQWNFHRQVIERIREVPGVHSAALVKGLPFSGNGGTTRIVLPDRDPPAKGSEPQVMLNTASREYFETTGIPLISGRSFNEQDHLNAPTVFLISKTLAAKFWPNEEAIGKQIRVVDDQRLGTVIGIVGDTKHYSVDEEILPQLYAAFNQNPGIFSTVVMKTAVEPMTLAESVRQAVWKVDPDQPMWKMRTVEFLLERNVADRKFLMLLMGIFASLALILAMIGLYGVISYVVNQRLQEIGVRMALGAQASDILGMVLRQGMILVLMGVGLGLAVAWLVTRLIERLLYQVSPTDPLTFAGIAVLLTVLALLACFLPARRATRVDPLVALRYE